VMHSLRFIRDYLLMNESGCLQASVFADVYKKRDIE
jgi:hypothetical protein